MTDRYQKEVLLRPPVEFYASSVAFISGLVCIWSPGFLMIPDAVGLVVGLCAILVSVYDFKRGYRIVRYRRGMSRTSPFTIKSGNLPVYSDRLYIGHGFEWEQKHTQRYWDTFDRKYRPFLKRKEYQLARAIQRNLQSIPVVNLISKFLEKNWMINPWPPKTGLGGDIGLNGVEEKHKEVCIVKPDRLQHTYLAGSTGTGKTEAMEVLIAQDIHRKSRDAVIVFDPKGSSSLLKTCYAEAGKAGRIDDVVVFHLGFPEISAMYNATGNYSRITEIASRLANQLPGEGSSASFKEFGWQAINLIIRTCESLGEPATLVTIKNNINDIGDLYVKYTQTKLVEKYGDDWKVSFDNELADVLDSDNKGKGPQNERTEEARATFNLLKNTRFKIKDDPLYSDLVEVFRMAPSHRMKLVASVRPLLEKLTSGQLEMLMSPTVSELKKGRKLLDWEQVIRKRSIVYVGLDAMADFDVASATGNAMLSDLVSTASRIYKHGHFGNIPGGEDEKVTTWLYMDEVDAIAGESFMPMCNKIRGASIGLVAASQTIQDIEVAMRSSAKQKVIIGNFNNLIMFRVKNIETAKLISEQAPKVSILQLTEITSAHDTDNMLDGSFFKSSNEDRATDTSVDMITEPMVMSLPTGQAFASIEGGNLYKIRFPLRIKDYDKYVPRDIADVAKAMDKRYRNGNDWYQLGDVS